MALVKVIHCKTVNAVAKIYDDYAVPGRKAEIEERCAEIALDAYLKKAEKELKEKGILA